MQRTCDGNDPTLLDQAGPNRKPCNCGKTFDDVDHSVIFPHPRIVGVPTVYNAENNWGYGKK